MSRIIPVGACMCLLIVVLAFCGCTGIPGYNTSPTESPTPTVTRTELPSMTATPTPAYQDAEFLLVYQSSRPRITDLSGKVDIALAKIQSISVVPPTWSALSSRSQDLLNAITNDSRNMSVYSNFQDPSNKKLQSSYLDFLAKMKIVATDLRDGAQGAANNDFPTALTSFEAAQSELNAITYTPTNDQMAVLEEMKIHLSQVIGVVKQKIANPGAAI
jgi:hypothetical protein